jgi:hypothetical protein
VTKQLILLAGLHKTGTTSIQRTCAVNLKLLHDAGFSYPAAEFQGQWESNHTRLFNGLFRREPHKTGLQSQFTVNVPREPGSLEAHRASFERVIADAARLIIAAEGVSLFDVDELREMKEWFVGRGWQVRVLCHVRHLSGWTSSIVGQRVTGALRMPIPRVVDEFIQYGSVVQRRIENLRQVFPDAEFFSHEQAVQHPQGPVGFFFQAIGFTPPAELKFVRANEGRSDCATRVLSIINEKFGPFDAQARPNAQVFNGEVLTRLLTAVGGQKFKLRQDEAHPLMALLQAENQWLGETLGEDFRDPGLEFKSAQWRWNPETVQQLQPVVGAMPRPVRSWVLSQLPLIGIQLPLR